MLRKRQAKIVATLGPSSSTFEMIESLFLEGVDVFRLNFSHGSHEVHKENYQYIREVEEKHKTLIGVLIDLQGPKIRVGKFKDGKISLTQGEKFILDLEDTAGDETRVNLPHPELFSAMKKGSTLLLDDGKLKLKITEIQNNSIITKVEVGGELSNRKGVNIPDVLLPISALTEKDKLDLEFGLSLGIDCVALSFVQSPEDVIVAREIIGNRAKIISKLEKPLAIHHLEEIVNLSDGVMVARGDLGVEMPIQYVPSIQKRIIHLCRNVGKPVIVATQMLESMIQVPTPTRAEASDVATAVYDGADAVMLSAESASGKYPIETVRMMDSIIQATEEDPYARIMWDAHKASAEIVEVDSVVFAAREIANLSKSLGIATFTASGRTVLRVVRERPYCPIFGLTQNIQIGRFMTLLWGVRPALVDRIENLDHMVKIAKDSVKKILPEENGQIVITAGIPFGNAGPPNILRIIQI